MKQESTISPRRETFTIRVTSDTIVSDQIEIITQKKILTRRCVFRYQTEKITGSILSLCLKRLTMCFSLPCRNKHIEYRKRSPYTTAVCSSLSYRQTSQMSMLPFAYTTMWKALLTGPIQTKFVCSSSALMYSRANCDPFSRSHLKIVKSSSRCQSKIVRSVHNFTKKQTNTVQKQTPFGSCRTS